MREEVKPRLGVVDSLSAGFALVTRRPWLMALPVLLDLLLWVLPRLSVQALMQPLLRNLEEVASASPDSAATAQMSVDLLSQLAGNFNLLSLLTNSSLRFPSFIAVQDSTAPELAHLTARVVNIGSLWAALPLALLLLLVSVLLAGIYLNLITWQVQGKPWDSNGFFKAVGRTWLHLTLFGVLLFLAVLLVSIPVGVGLALLTMLTPALAALASTVVLLLILSVGLWLALLLHFVVEAIVLDGVGAWQAIWRSLNIVMRNFWSTLGLVILGWVLGQGFTIIWQSIGSGSVGVIAGVLGNAYIGSGLAAAYIFFYRDRRRRWQQALSGRKQATVRGWRI